MPMVITEAGWHSDPDLADQPSSPEIQARYVAEFFTQSMAGDVDVMIWWTLSDIVGWLTENGLVTFDNPPVKKISSYNFV